MSAKGWDPGYGAVWHALPQRSPEYHSAQVADAHEGQSLEDRATGHRRIRITHTCCLRAAGEPPHRTPLSGAAACAQQLIMISNHNHDYYSSWTNQIMI